ncbi:MAG TPA: ABC transporter permease [Gammaproteobacteria bacterium]|nr:ABC transporter permease [Gammaproteobacteria bacterium]
MPTREYYVAFKTIVVREIVRFVRIWVQTVLPAMIMTALYFVIFGNLVGSHIGTVGGVDFIAFIVPGLILMSVITNAYGNVVSSFYSSKFQGNIDEMLVAPIPNWIILVGYITGGLMRGLVVGLAVTLVATFFVDMQIHNLTVVITTVILTALLFSMAGLVNAIYAKSFDDISIVPTFVLTPLTYLGGIFYSIDMLNNFWHHVSLFNPVLYMINAFRFGFLGISDISLVTAYTIIIAFVVGLFVFALFLLERGTGIRN